MCLSFPLSFSLLHTHRRISPFPANAKKQMGNRRPQRERETYYYISGNWAIRAPASLSLLSYSWLFFIAGSSSGILKPTSEREREEISNEWLPRGEDDGTTYTAPSSAYSSTPSSFFLSLSLSSLPSFFFESHNSHAQLHGHVRSSNEKRRGVKRNPFSDDIGKSVGLLCEVWAEGGREAKNPFWLFTALSLSLRSKMKDV